MAAAFIFLFLTGAVLAWRFRVWILIPFTVLTIIASTATEFAHGSGAVASLGIGFLVGWAPQLGYAFGLFTTSTITGSRAPLSGQPERRSVARLFRSHAVKDVR